MLMYDTVYAPWHLSARLSCFFLWEAELWWLSDMKYFTPQDGICIFQSNQSTHTVSKRINHFQVPCEESFFITLKRCNTSWKSKCSFHIVKSVTHLSNLQYCNIIKCIQMWKQPPNSCLTVISTLSFGSSWIDRGVTKQAKEEGHFAEGDWLEQDCWKVLDRSILL